MFTGSIKLGILKVVKIFEMSLSETIAEILQAQISWVRVDYWLT